MTDPIDPPLHVFVYGFEMYNIVADKFQPSKRKTTIETIKEIGARRIPDTAQFVSMGDMDDGFFTPKP